MYGSEWQILDLHSSRYIMEEIRPWIFLNNDLISSKGFQMAKMTGALATSLVQRL